MERVELAFDLERDATHVRSRLSVRRNDHAKSNRVPLVLDGEDLELHHVRLNGADLVIGEFDDDGQRLIVPEVPDAFELETEVEIHPRANTRLSGLYLSNGVFCTQCEATGFRRITYFLDRPDVMARYSVRIEADRARCPVLLSNGNRAESGQLPNGRHFVRYEDPFKKPSYLFALVAEQPDVELTVDLEAQLVHLPGDEDLPFDVDPFAKVMLLAGTDEIGYLLGQEADIAAYEAAHPPRIDTRAVPAR